MQLNDAADATSAAYDANSLQKLRAQAAQSSPQALKNVARQVEGVFVQMMLKSMRAAVPKGGLFDSNQSDLYTSLYDQQIAQQLTAKKGLGLAEMMVKQLGRGGGPDDVAAAKDKDIAAQVPVDLPAQRAPDAMMTSYMTPQLMGEFLRRDGRHAEPGAGDNESAGKSFTDKLQVPAMVASRQSGISHHLILAQAALESDWGRKEIPTADGTPSYNLFGIKAGGDWQGKTTNVITTEYQNGQPVKVRQRFRVYDSYLDAIGDYIHVLTDNPRYRDVVNAGQPEAAAYALQRAGYATDPAYGAKLVQIIGQLKNAAGHAVSAYTRDLGGLF
jgi:flagellar protein FlgJ